MFHKDLCSVKVLTQILAMATVWLWTYRFSILIAINFYSIFHKLKDFGRIWSWKWLHHLVFSDPWKAGHTLYNTVELASCCFSRLMTNNWWAHSIQLNCWVISLISYNAITYTIQLDICQLCGKFCVTIIHVFCRDANVKSSKNEE